MTVAFKGSPALLPLESRPAPPGPQAAGPAAASERLLVCVSPSPLSALVVQATWRMATRLGAPWVAAYVETPASLRLSARDRESLIRRVDTRTGAEHSGEHDPRAAHRSILTPAIASRAKRVRVIVDTSVGTRGILPRASAPLSESAGARSRATHLVSGVWSIQLRGMPAETTTMAAPDPSGLRLRQDLRQAGLHLVHEEELDVPVMEVRSGQELVDWAWAFGMGRILLELPEAFEESWAAELARAGEANRKADGWIRLGGRTRIVLAR